MMLATVRDYITGSTWYLAINASLMVAVWLLVTLQMASIVRELTHLAEREPPISPAQRAQKLRELRLIHYMLREIIVRCRLADAPVPEERA